MTPELRRSLDEAGKRGLALFVGAGVSASPPSSLPGWYELSELISDAICVRVDEELGRPDWTEDLRGEFRERRTTGFPPDYQAQILEEVCGEEYFRALQSLGVDSTNEAHRNIARLAADGVLNAVEVD